MAGPADLLTGTQQSSGTPQAAAMSLEEFTKNAKQYIDTNKEGNFGRGPNPYGSEDVKRAYDDYIAKGATWKPPAPAQTPEQAAQAQAGVGSTTNVVAGNATGANQTNVTNAGAELINNPDKLVSGSSSLAEQNKQNQMTGTEAGTNINPNDPKYAMDADKLKQTAAQGQADTAAQVDPRTANTYEVDKTQDKVAGEDIQGEQGTVSEEATIEAPQIDIGAIAGGTDANGVGKALSDYAYQNLDQVDQKATVKGQLDLLQEDFVGPNGEPKIPAWAQATAKSVGRITAFTGGSGTAATAAMAAALMEASLPIASQDAAFFQTLTVKNLDNKQASIINKANVLAKMESQNADARLTAAIENSKSFLAMDMKNLDNKQQAAIINNQNRVQSILEDSKQENAKRLFTADSQNNMDMYYDNMNTQIDQFNAVQKNAMEQFNVNQSNDMSKYNADMENNREQFYKSMQFNIDTANAKWRQTVTLQEDTQAFEAAATDVKNMIGISTEQLNQLWDRSDSLLDYAWKSSESAKDRDAAIALKKLEAKLTSKQKDKEGLGTMLGSVGSSIIGSIFG